VTGIRGDEDGQFLFLGLAEGRNLVSAEGEQGTSEEVIVDVLEDRAGPPLRLVLQPRKTLTGRVISPDGGVPRASVTAVTYSGSSAPDVRMPNATTDVTGAFRMKISARATHIQLNVFPPGYTLTVFPIQEIPEEPLTLVVEPHAGSLAFQLTKPIDWEDPWSPRPALFLDGVPLPWYVLKRWADINGEWNREPGRFTLPALKATDYTACLLPASPVAVPVPLVPDASVCQVVTVVPFAETVVEIHTSAEGHQ
jgi:hypothetical protein